MRKADVAITSNRVKDSFLVIFKGGFKVLIILGATFGLCIGYGFVITLDIQNSLVLFLFGLGFTGIGGLIGNRS